MDNKLEQGNEKNSEKELEDCRKKRDEYLDGWKRTRAEFLNYKSEEMERIAGLIKYANEEIVLKLFPILDNFDEGEKNISPELKDSQWVTGVMSIKSQLREFLKKYHVTAMETIGQKFDPNRHEVVEEIQQDGAEPEVIVQEVQKGYLCEGKVIRPAKVKITK